MIGALDTNVIIGLSKGECFETLHDLFASLFVPPKVREETIDEGQGLPGAPELAAALGKWVAEENPTPQALQGFAHVKDEGDRQLLSLAKDKQVDYILTDDQTVWDKAAKARMKYLRSTDLVVLMRAKGLVAEVKPVLNLMRQRGYGIRDDLYEEALRAAGEWAQP